MKMLNVLVGRNCTLQIATTYYYLLLPITTYYYLLQPTTTPKPQVGSDPPHILIFKRLVEKQGQANQKRQRDQEQ